jgi:Na+-translocating ferredoxin:NAD+ oxidoreductase RnfA subunit
MSDLLQGLGTFLLYALIAIFVQNAVFTRAFGVSRLTKLVQDGAGNSLIFCGLLCLVSVISAIPAYLLNSLLMLPRMWFRDYIRPLVFVVCALAAFFIVLGLLRLTRLKNRAEFEAVLPMSTLNVAVLGPMLISAAQRYGFAQTMGFALGSALGHGLAVLLVTEGQRKMNSHSVPPSMRGLPINLIYVGILALAIYGLTGHMVAI